MAGKPPYVIRALLASAITGLAVSGVPRFIGCIDRTEKPHRADIEKPQQAPIAFVRGYTWGWVGERGDYSDVAAQDSLARLAATGTTWISLSFAAHVTSAGSTEILFGAADDWMVTDEEICGVIDVARRHGMRIMLKPVVNSRDGVWRATFDFGNAKAWECWWQNYASFILHYARIAASADCEMFCIGCEMRSMEPDAQRWRTLIDQVRAIYGGVLVYNANHTDIANVSWFDAVDVIGVSAYWPISAAHDSSLDCMLTNWQPVRAQLRELSSRFNRPILLAEIGVRSARGCSAMPWDWEHTDLPYDGDEQARYYEAAFRTYWDQPWCVGFFWWDWKSELHRAEDAGANTDFGVYGKPAEAVLRAWYTRER